MIWLGIILGIPLAGLLYQWAGERRDRRLHPPPGEFTETPQGRFHFFSTGGGDGPAVLLEAGISASSLSWRGIHDRLPASCRTWSYDRPGYGWSPASKLPRVIPQLLSELHALVESLAPGGPLILVGHSFGGLLLRHYAARHPETVAGLVLLDPLEPEEWASPSPIQTQRLRRAATLARRGALLARLGVVRLALDLLMSGSRAIPQLMNRLSSGSGSSVADRLVGEVRKMPRDVWPMVRVHWSLPQGFLTMAEYLERLPENCATPLDSQYLREIPLVVISASTTSPEVVALHRRTAALSTRGTHLIAEASNHWVHLDRPDLVIDAILKPETGDSTLCPQP